jgi:hypothetical protein
MLVLKINTELLDNSALPLLGIYPEELKIDIKDFFCFLAGLGFELRALCLQSRRSTS